MFTLPDCVNGSAAVADAGGGGTAWDKLSQSESDSSEYWPPRTIFRNSNRMHTQLNETRSWLHTGLSELVWLGLWSVCYTQPGRVSMATDVYTCNDSCSKHTHTKVCTALCTPTPVLPSLVGEYPFVESYICKHILGWDLHTEYIYTSLT